MSEDWGMVAKVQQIIEQANNIVCLNGLGTVVESGGKDLWEREEFYRIERQYGKSPEEMLSAAVYSAKKERFFNFYKKEILSQKVEPSETFSALRKLQECGKLKSVISLNINGLEYRSGIRNVLELSGSIYNNACPLCGRQYSVEYVENAKAVPICDKCEGAIRPGIRLFGERVQNNLFTEAATACSKADVIIVLGMNLFGGKVQYCTGHYKGDKLILINEEEHFMDRHADYVIHSQPKNILPQLVLQIPSSNNKTVTRETGVKRCDT